MHVGDFSDGVSLRLGRRLTVARCCRCWCGGGCADSSSSSFSHGTEGLSRCCCCGKGGWFSSRRHGDDVVVVLVVPCC